MFYDLCEVVYTLYIPFLRQENSMGDQQLDTKNITSRFRTNFVVAGVEAFEEDNWSHLVIGNTRFLVSWREIMEWAGIMVL